MRKDADPLFVLFFVSGFSGLIYESVWSHYVKLFLGHAAYAIRDRVQRFERSAERVARAPQPDYVRETVEQMTAQHAVKANVAVIRTADAMVGTLFDIVA